jgi:hypothetical protein
MVDFEIKVTRGTAQQFADKWDEERGVSQMGKQTFEVLRHVAARTRKENRPRCCGSAGSVVGVVSREDNSSAWIKPSR